jgi:hypothetical protein
MQRGCVRSRSKGNAMTKSPFAIFSATASISARFRKHASRRVASRRHAHGDAATALGNAAGRANSAVGAISVGFCGRQCGCILNRARAGRAGGGRFQHSDRQRGL